MYRLTFSSANNISCSSKFFSTSKENTNNKFTVRKNWFTPKKKNNHSLTDYSPSNTNSPVYFGTKYELETLDILKQFKFELTRTGGAGDKGIDLKGFWKLPDRTINVICQCKTEKKKCSPNYIRELEGTLNRELSKKRDSVGNQETIGILVSESGFSTEATEYAFQANYPIVLSVVDNRNMLLQQFYPNPRVSSLIPELSVTTSRTSIKPSHSVLLYKVFSLAGKRTFFEFELLLSTVRRGLIT